MWENLGMFWFSDIEALDGLNLLLPQYHPECKHGVPPRPFWKQHWSSLTEAEPSPWWDSSLYNYIRNQICSPSLKSNFCGWQWKFGQSKEYSVCPVTCTANFKLFFFLPSKLLGISQDWYWCMNILKGLYIAPRLKTKHCCVKQNLAVIL